MADRREFEMTEDDYNGLIEACKPVPAMYLSGGAPMFGTPQDNANAAWGRLGERMGFDGMSVEPSPKGGRFFTAVPKEGA